MRYRLMVCVLILAVSVCGVDSARASDAEAGKFKVEKYAVGKATVWAIADSLGDRGRFVFPNAKPELLDKYMPSGGCPSAIMTFLVKTGDEIVLIDTGFGASSGDSASMLMAGIAQTGIAPEQVTVVLLTHMHTDHVGGLILNDKKMFPSARVLSSRVEREFWRDEKLLERYPDRKVNFEMVVRFFEIYGDAIEDFEFGDTVAPGINAIDIHGHTPGHTAFMLESEGEKMFFWGDIIHAAALQFPHPEINAMYDMLPEDAASARARSMESAATEKFSIAGAHLPFPGIGTVEKASEGYLYKSSR